MTAYSKMNMESKNISSHINKEMSTRNKMNYEKNTVKQLRIIATERGGVKGYWKLRKADLIAKIKSAEAKHEHILDAPVPDTRISTSDTWKSKSRGEMVAPIVLKMLEGMLGEVLSRSPEVRQALANWKSRY